MSPFHKQYPFDAFTKQLEDNLFKKYNMFYGTLVETSPLSELFVFQKQVCNRVVTKRKGVIFNYLSREKDTIIQFGLDAGLGELNSPGFGFMNVVR